MLKPLCAFLLFAPHLAAASAVDTAFARIYGFDFASGRAFSREYTASPSALERKHHGRQ